MSQFNFGKLVRFKDISGREHFGEVSEDFSTYDSLVGQTVQTYSGENPWDHDFQLRGEKAKIAEILSPIKYMPIAYGIGLNYKAHAAESNLKSGDYPIVFTKPPDALAGPYEEIPFSKELQFMDYEGELAVVIGKPLRDFKSGDNFAPYILGYTVGNDVSSRYWQRPERSNGQHAYAKSFDKFGPIGPVLASTAAIPDPTALTLKTLVNGQQRQQTGTNDLIFDIPAILQHLSRGTTLQPGTVIFTGTPSGVASFMKPQVWLTDNDVVEVEITGIGRIRNTFVLQD